MTFFLPGFEVDLRRTDVEFDRFLKLSIGKEYKTLEGGQSYVCTGIPEK